MKALPLNLKLLGAALLSVMVMSNAIAGGYHDDNGVCKKHSSNEPFTFAVMVDTAYLLNGESNFDKMIDEQLHAERFSFIVHVGDTGGGNTCA